GSDAPSGQDTSVGTPDGGQDTSLPPVDASPDTSTDAADASLDSSTDAGADASTTDASIDGAAEAGAGVSLIGKWTFDEGTGTTSADLSGRGHAASLKGAASWTASGKSGSGLLLDGTNGYAD